MAKSLFIAEKPSVAAEFAKTLGEKFDKKDGFSESPSYVVTWCVGHLVTMSYPEVYDEKYKKWLLQDLPFLPKEYKYEIIPGVAKQFKIVKNLLNRNDVGCIYICTDSGREGEYIYRLVDQMAAVPKAKLRKRVWIDSQTEDEIKRGIKEAKDWSFYDRLSESAYLRAKDDYLMGINFSRLLSLKFGRTVNELVKSKSYIPISVGRVMTCVQGMVVRREREIREFVKTPFYRVVTNVFTEFEFRACEGSDYFESPKMYKENGFKKKEDAEKLIEDLKATSLTGDYPIDGVIESVQKKKEVKNPPLLYNLAELQNDCSRMFKISPDKTLQIVQELYEKKLVTYPRTDARVLSSAIAKEIYKNIGGLKNYSQVSEYASEILDGKKYLGIEKTKYVNDKQITDHYAIIPTGQGFNNFASLSSLHKSVYECIARRFLSIFYPAAVYQRLNVVLKIGKEKFFASEKVLEDEGYLKVATKYKKESQSDNSGNKNDANSGNSENATDADNTEEAETDLSNPDSVKKMKALLALKKGDKVKINELLIKEGETSPPKRYNSGSIILAMENAGQLIEDEELRAQIKSNGIGTSATRAEILKKLEKNTYIRINAKTQVITPTMLGEMIFEVVNASIRPLLNPELTASWEKGLNYVSEGTITGNEYMTKLENFVAKNIEAVRYVKPDNYLAGRYAYVSKFY
ncbi:MAG: DNA topoisomerase [Lachnospiraceae bacterium]|nr:DNA topoisomerase [Lachnospiraceae bacterium]